ncbi:MAG TPA: hypothetical protein VKM55_07755 [Candidatus Lokiarchaeia archaeon]|nr:hypothetical protein [Candidatus Lokiarchaeia archaeon]
MRMFSFLFAFSFVMYFLGNLCALAPRHGKVDNAELPYYDGNLDPAITFKNQAIPPE